MRALVALVLLWGGAASAQTAVFFEDHGCTIGPESQAAAAAVGIDAADIDLLLRDARGSGQVREVGSYAVLGAELCTIRLPDLTLDVSLDDPHVAAQIVRYDEVPGCYFGDVPRAMEEAGAQAADYAALLGAGFLNGDLRFYASSPLSTPITIQVMRGSCGDVPERADMDAAAAVLTDEVFDQYVRAVAQNTPCDDGPNGQAIQLMADIQMAAGIEESRVNAWMWFELNMIAWAAGWRIGMTWDERGQLRPPLCDHYE